MEKVNLNFKFRSRPEKKKELRKQLVGSDCLMCQQYYASLYITKEDKQIRIQNCSKHRDKFKRSLTPENFWSIDFPEYRETVEIRPLKKWRN